MSTERRRGNPVTDEGELIVAQSDTPGWYRALVDPEIAGTPTPEIEIDGAGTAPWTGAPNVVRITFNPGDDLAGAQRLRTGQPDVVWCVPGEKIAVRSSVPITDVYLIGVDYDTAAGTYTDTAYIIASADADDADWLAQQAHLTFSSADEIREVIVEVSAVYNTSFARVKVQGVSHA